jgi:hypothetical protein
LQVTLKENKHMKGAVTILLLALCSTLALASNPQDEQTVRTAYAKLAYAVQVRTVLKAATRNPKLDFPTLNRELQANELRFEISEITSGALREIAARPYSDFVTPTDDQPVLKIASDTEDFEDQLSGKHATSLMAVPHWAHGSVSREDWSTPVGKVEEMAGIKGKYSRYVALALTVRFQGRSRTYKSLWYFGSDILPVDPITGNNILNDFATRSAFPSVLTDTSLHSQTGVSEWLTSNQRYDSSCKAGKNDVCCDAASLRCGVHADDLRSTKAAPTTTAIKGRGL